MTHRSMGVLTSALSGHCYQGRLDLREHRGIADLADAVGSPDNASLSTFRRYRAAAVANSREGSMTWSM
jgi:hypothetical protein